MKVSGRIIGIIVLVSFALMAGSVVCFASGQANVMDNCGNGMTTGAICPFMSATVQAIANTSSAARILGLVALLLIVGFVSRHSSEDGRAEKFLAIARERDPATGRRSDVVLNLISDGILHSRVFGS